MGSVKLLLVGLAVTSLVAAVAAKNSNKFIDLTYAFNADTVTFPGRKPSFNIETEGYTHGGFWVASKGFCTSEHTATHIDAPYHFHKEGATLDKIPLENLIDQPGVMIDVYDKVHTVVDGQLKVIENYVMTREDIIEWENKNGKIPERSIVLVRTGWGSRWPDKRLFRGEKKNSTEGESLDLSGPLDLNFPGFDASAAKFLAVERNVIGVGIDTLSIDSGNSVSYPSHQLFAARSIWMLEMVANLHLLPPNGFHLWVVPFKIDQGTGAPTRVLARLNN